MTRPDELRIADILDVCQEVQLLTEKGHEKFGRELILQRAAERMLEIIGEAASNLNEEAKELYPTIDWRRIMKLRIVLAHQYHRVDSEQVWMILTHDVPQLFRHLTSNN